MYGLSVSFPLEKDETDGFYKLNKDYPSMVAQNLKNLMLTEPGERIMDPEFGVGLRSIFFEQDSDVARGFISTRTQQQIQTYMPFLELRNLEIRSEGHMFRVDLEVNIAPLGKTLILPVEVKGLT